MDESLRDAALALRHVLLSTPRAESGTGPALSDALAMLVRWRSTPARAARAALHQITSVGAGVTGVALTMVNLKVQSQSGFGDPSGYADYMKDYYAKS